MTEEVPARQRQTSLLPAGEAEELPVVALGELQQASADRSHKLTARDLAAIHEAHAFLEQNLASPPDIAMLGRRVGINRTKLLYGFKQIYGVSASQFIHRQRMDYALRLLITTDKSILDIAVELGYEHACNFSTRFKGHFGRSPREVRGSSSRRAAKAEELLVFAPGDLQQTSANRSCKLTDRDLAAIREAHDILEQDFASRLYIAMLSRQVGINRTKLFYGFKQIYGVSASQLIHRRRMDYARHLLITTDKSISAIAVELGYEHACNFSTRFKAHFGQSPRDIRGSSSRRAQD